MTFISSFIQPRRKTFHFFFIWIGQTASLLGSMIVQFALVWWFAKTTGSGTALALGGILGLLPSVIIGPFAGVLVDRWDRRYVMIIADGLQASVALVLVFLFALGKVQLWHVYTVAFVRAIFSTFHGPAWSTVTALMVSREQMTRFQGLNQAVGSAMGMVVPMLGALFVVYFPMPIVLMIDVLTALTAIIPLCFTHIPRPTVQPRSRLTPAAMLQDLRDGLYYVTSWRGLFLLCLIGAGLNFFGAPLSTLLPLLVTRHFHGPASQLGILNVVTSIGSLLGGLTLSVWGGFKNRVVTCLVGIALSGVFVLLLAASPLIGFQMALTAMFCLGAINTLINGPINALLLTVVAPEKIGRVSTMLSSLTGIAMPLGLAFAGPFSDLVSIPVVFSIIGLIYTLTGLTMFAVHDILYLETQAKEFKEKASI